MGSGPTSCRMPCAPCSSSVIGSPSWPDWSSADGTSRAAGGVTARSAPPGRSAVTRAVPTNERRRSAGEHGRCNECPTCAPRCSAVACRWTTSTSSSAPRPTPAGRCSSATNRCSSRHVQVTSSSTTHGAPSATGWTWPTTRSAPDVHPRPRRRCTHHATVSRARWSSTARSIPSTARSSPTSSTA